MTTAIQELHKMYSRACELGNRLDEASSKRAEVRRSILEDRLGEVWRAQIGYGAAILNTPVVDDMDELLCLAQMQYEIEDLENAGVNREIARRMSVAIENLIAFRWRKLGSPDLGNSCSNSVMRWAAERSEIRSGQSEIVLAA